MIRPITFSIGFLLAVSYSQLSLSTDRGVDENAGETAVQLIPLTAPLNQKEAEISGMAWCRDKLILLPENPGFENSDGEYLYALDIAQIDAFLSGQDINPLSAQKIELEEHKLGEIFPGFDGFEAIACDKDNIWLAAEIEIEKPLYETRIFKAAWLDQQNGIERIQLDSQSNFKIDSQSKLDNYSDESLIIQGSHLISIHEANRLKSEKAVSATKLFTDTKLRQQLAIPQINYRLTDATAVDEQGYFWATNYMWSEEQDRFSTTDQLFKLYGRGRSHMEEATVERLIKFKLQDTHIELAATPPIQLKLSKEDGRNWEGVARYRDQGLLLVTDMHPRTLLGFVPFAEGTEVDSNKLTPRIQN